MPNGKILHALLCVISLSCISVVSAHADSTADYPYDPRVVEQLTHEASQTVYAPVIDEWKQTGLPLSKSNIEKLWRINRKAAWRKTDAAGLSQIESRIKILTQKTWKAFQWGGESENADPASPFVVEPNDPRPSGMPSGCYALSSGDVGYLFPSLAAMLRNEDGVAFKIEFQQVTRDGRIVVQQAASLDADESLGWDGRFEYQPNARGGFEIVLTQGAMELPINLQGAASNAPLLPRASVDNEFRSRHLFKLLQWVSSQNGQAARLVVRDQGSILGFNPSTEHRYIQVDARGQLQHAHGYGESFLPSANDVRKPWIDEQGYAWRAFDMVTRERTLIDRDSNGNVRQRFIPMETRAVAVRMDPRNPSRRAPGGGFVFMTSNYNPRTHAPYPATIRYAFDTRGAVSEERSINENESVQISTQGLKQNEPALLNEGLNFAEQVAHFPDNDFYLATNSAGEYTSGGLPSPNQKFYGTYLWYRKVREGRIGPYHPVLNAAGDDLQDMFREITQMYGASWGIGRAQLFGGSGGNGLWAKAHMVDVDLLVNNPLMFPQSGYPQDNSVFSHAYRRHQVEFPVKVIETGGIPSLEIDDPRVQSDLLAWRARQAAL